MYVDGVVVKLASRCNLNCSYCYMYNKGDDSFLGQPKFMSEDTVNEFAQKLENYLIKYNKKQFIIVFHGGEPMLAGMKRMEDFVNAIQNIEVDVDFHFGIQTNGVLINEEWVEFFDRMKITVGVSIDGTKESNDTYRIYKNGKSSYEEIVRGINFLADKNPDKFGVLTVIDIAQSPDDVYNHYKELGLSNINLLFPDDTHDDDFVDDLKLGKWLVGMYDLWNVDTDKERVHIEQFIKLNGLMLGMHVNDEYYGKGKPNTFILETDGQLQANDPMRVCHNGMATTEVNVYDDEIDDLYKLPISFMYYNNHDLLCDKCSSCELESVCAGGYVLNRYSKKSGFDNPSIFCKSLAYFICHVQNVLLDSLDDDFVKESGITPLNFKELNKYLEKESTVENQFLKSFNLQSA